MQTIDLFEKGELSFEKSFQQLLPRPWVVDNVDQFVDAWTDKQWRKVRLMAAQAVEKGGAHR